MRPRAAARVPDFPPALMPWADQLDQLDAPSVEVLGRWLPRLRSLMGPPRRPTPGAQEPDGLDGLSNRGRPERLLPMEWALADMAPDEFLRRAAMGEQMYYRLAQNSPGGDCRSVLLLDAGWEQVGAPRLAHIALLLVFARRAAQADLPFYWGVAQAGGGLFEGLDPGNLRCLLQARTARPVNESDLDSWWVTLEPGPDDDLWLVGGDGAVSQATRLGVGWVRVTEPLTTGPRRLLVETANVGFQPRHADLELPPERVAVRVLRDPLDTDRVQSVADRNRLDPDGGLLAFQGACRLVGMTTEGNLAGYHVPNSPRDKPGKVRLAKPDDWEGTVVAVRIKSGHFMLAYHDEAEAQLLLQWRSRRGISRGSAPLRFTPAPGTPPFAPPKKGQGLHRLLVGFDSWGAPPLRKAMILDGERRLYGLPIHEDGRYRETDHYTLLYQDVAAVSCMRLVRAVCGASIGVPRIHDGQIKKKGKSPFPSRGWKGGAFFGDPRGEAGDPEWGLLALEYGDRWLVSHRQGTRTILSPPGEVVGVACPVHDEPTLVAIRPDRQMITLCGPHVIRPLVDSPRLAPLRGDIVAAALDGDILGILDSTGVVAAYNLAQREFTLVIRPEDKR